jgi:formate dehydrogenase iron-sulfur subunit
MTASHLVVRREGKALVRLLLADQQKLSAVEKFSQQHDECTLGSNEVYRDLIPLSAPGKGEQYAFEVDLDSCTGCKACVTACHSMNGLDDDEVWRQVGIVLGRGPAAAYSQTVTTACHHCVDPACLSGCPVAAYEKDPVTGIVRHLDDQCIGCQYCVLKCPYDVPKYNASRGIVRKCDMCQGRLSAGEAPACVQACPNGAIRITVTSQAEALARETSREFLPGAPAPAYTHPTTVYKTARDIPQDARAADHHRLRVEPGHAPLVAMLVLTQAALGVLLFHRLLSELAPGSLPAKSATGLGMLAAAFTLAGISLATLHLGRPLYAFRAFLGLRTSWLSRETVVFGALAPLAILHASARSLGLPASIERLAGTGALLSGAAAVLCSVMVYVDTRRAFWSLARTAWTFLLTAIVLGAASVATVLAQGGGSDGAVRCLLGVVAASTLLKLGIEATALRHLQGPRTDMQRTALVMSRLLRPTMVARHAAGVAGGVIAPALLLSGVVPGPVTGPLALVVLILCFAGELLERSLFFRAVSAPRMPGASPV